MSEKGKNLLRDGGLATHETLHKAMTHPTDITLQSIRQAVGDQHYQLWEQRARQKLTPTPWVFRGAEAINAFMYQTIRGFYEEYTRVYGEGKRASENAGREVLDSQSLESLGE